LIPIIYKVKIQRIKEYSVEGIVENSFVENACPQARNSLIIQ